jgi:hypothetical protein
MLEVASNFSKYPAASVFRIKYKMNIICTVSIVVGVINFEKADEFGFGFRLKFE